ncbi:ABC transporter substrate-binding protein [Actinoallomurus purpureus]|uniref:ABC transporter substrate-binding protein n=1 Tax=Actinoallomurus purpureus TaxID=478114 RepID=UPI0020939149|nr:ABC transporter substrate-binding protein [Actinoallomurus purpureus]MCO6007789.1 ABC transporter substrate-binding protein [Actinoallomurus purpureus]
MRRSIPLVATGLAATLALAACGGGSGGSSGNSGGDGSFNAGLTRVVNPSTKTGGTLHLANAGDWDNVDPADTYYAFSWNFARFYGRTLMMFKPSPGKSGLELTPDLAQGPGQHSADLKTWTYKLKPGVKYEDGTPVKAQDIKYDIERSLDKKTFPNGPTYFNDYLDLQGYTSPYNDKTPGKLGLKAVETPDDSTIVFHLKKPFGAFDYFAMLPSTMPVPPAKDTGANYKQHVVATGPYKFESYTPGKSIALVRNTNWDPSTDPNRKQLPDRVEVQLGINADDVDNRLINGSLQSDVQSTGVQAAAAGRIQTQPRLKQNADAAPTARLWYVAISGDVAPFDNVHCRRAVEYVADKQAMQTAFGGPLSGGDIATHLIMPVLPGSKDMNPYPSGPGNHGDIAKAKQELAACGKPNGFKTVISARTERTKEVNAALAMQQSLAKIGVQVEIKKYPQGDYFKLYAGKPEYVKKNGLGLMMMAWAADWPEGFGYLSQIVDSRVIRDAGNTNLGVKDPEVDKTLDKAVVTADETARNDLWAQIDAKVMDDAYIVPFLNVKGLMYRPPSAKNTYINQGLNGEYDFVQMGVK